MNIDDGNNDVVKAPKKGGHGYQKQPRNDLISKRFMCYHNHANCKYYEKINRYEHTNKENLESEISSVYDAAKKAFDKYRIQLLEDCNNPGCCHRMFLIQPLPSLFNQLFSNRVSKQCVRVNKSFKWTSRLPEELKDSDGNVLKENPYNGKFNQLRQHFLDYHPGDKELPLMIRKLPRKYKNRVG